jgi:hypothetical protein
MMRFVHLGINPVGAIAGQPNAQWPPNLNAVLENYLNAAAGWDWFRYGAQNYVLWTDANLNDLARGIAALPGFQIVYVLVTEFTLSQCSGWEPQPFWQWLQQSRR